MQKIALTVEYELGNDRLMDVFIEHSQLVSESVACFATTDGMWRVDRIVGPPRAVEAVEGVVSDPGHCNECPGPGGCGVDREYETLARTATSYTVYASRSTHGAVTQFPRWRPTVWATGSCSKCGVEEIATSGTFSSRMTPMSMDSTTPSRRGSAMDSRSSAIMQAIRSTGRRQFSTPSR